MKNLQTASVEERADRPLFMRAADRFADQVGDGKDFDLAAAPGFRAERHGVGGDQLLQGRFVDLPDRRAGQHGVSAAGENSFRALALERAGGHRERPGGVDHVVEQDRGLVLDLADDVHLGDDVGAGPPLVDDRQRGVEAGGEIARALDAARVGRNNGHFVMVQPLLDVLEQHRRRVKVVHRYVEKTLDLARVQVHGQNPRSAGGRDEIGDELGADGNARRDLAVLPGVAVVRDDRRDALRRGALEGVEHQEQLHQVVVAGRAGGLDHEHVAAAHVLLDLDLALAVAERLHDRLAERHVQVPADLPRERQIRIAGEYFQLVLVLAHGLYGENRTAGASKQLRHPGPSKKNWLGGKDSNLRYRIQRPVPYLLATAHPNSPGNSRPGNSLHSPPSARSPPPSATTLLYSAMIFSSIILRVSLLIGWAMSRYVPSLRFLLGMETKSPVAP